MVPRETSLFCFPSSPNCFPRDHTLHIYIIYIIYIVYNVQEYKLYVNCTEKYSAQVRFENENIVDISPRMAADFLVT